ncbi:hypothetical protein Droror1_Dr00019522 [Drosera rotundifolia]
MYKNQLQELAQRSCFNLPSYTSIREGPDHAPRFKAVVNFNGESFESPHYCSTLRQAEHAAAEVALSSLSNRGPSHSLAARILDETGVYKNLLQEISQRVRAPLPRYSTYRSGLGHQPVFTGTVELAGVVFTGEPAKNKKQAGKNAALAAWTSLKQLAQETGSSSSETESTDELEQVSVARALTNFQTKERMKNPGNGPIVFPQRFPGHTPRPPSPQRPAATTSKILPFIYQKSPHRIRPPPRPPVVGDSTGLPSQPQRFPAAGAAPYVPLRYSRVPCHNVAPPVTIRNTIPVYSAPPLPSPHFSAPPMMRSPHFQFAPPVCVRPVMPVHAVPSQQRQDATTVQKEDLATVQKTTSLTTNKLEPVLKEEQTSVLENKTKEKSEAAGTETGESKPATVAKDESTTEKEIKVAANGAVVAKDEPNATSKEIEVIAEVEKMERLKM